MGVPRLTDHAVERYQERLQRPMSFKQAKVELICLLPFGEFSEEPPEWLPFRGRNVSGYWLLGDVCLVLCSKRVAVTCITRGELPRRIRTRRNRARRSRRYRLAKTRGC
ncbi:MAG: hypothetical protein QOF36_2572 [Microbacteriaceae bacterium]|jgi:hypothetical protein|nr:hypothetical protein [Microbacteriaceae bacterium]